LDESARETFATGRPLEDVLNLQQCKHCKKGVLRTAAAEHIAACLRIKKEKAQRKKEAREARERAKEEARAEEARKNDGDGDTKMGGTGGAGAGAGADSDDDDDDDENSPDKKNKASKKVGAKKPDGDAKGKKRKADGDADKGSKNKKKKEEPKPKVAKPKGKKNESACPPLVSRNILGMVLSADTTLPKDLSMSRSSVVFCCLTGSHVHALSLARVTAWAPSAPWPAVLCHMTCSWQPTRRRTRRNSKVRVQVNFHGSLLLEN